MHFRRLFFFFFELQGEGALNGAQDSVNICLHITQLYVYGFKSVCENEVHGNRMSRILVSLDSKFEQ